MIVSEREKGKDKFGEVESVCVRVGLSFIYGN